jgi:hypothetical protein
MPDSCAVASELPVAELVTVQSEAEFFAKHLRHIQEFQAGDTRPLVRESFESVEAMHTAKTRTGRA